MNVDAKYDFLMWGVTLVAVAVFFSLGVIALLEQEVFVSWRVVSGWSQGLGAEIIGWLFFGAAGVILSRQLKISKFWFLSYTVYGFYFLALIGYVAYNAFL